MSKYFFENGFGYYDEPDYPIYTDIDIDFFIAAIPEDSAGMLLAALAEEIAHYECVVEDGFKQYRIDDDWGNWIGTDGHGRDWCELNVYIHIEIEGEREDAVDLVDTIEAISRMYGAVDFNITAHSE